MATQARFGRLPRSAPSLTSTIVALAQEYQRVRESNIVNAWKNGGEFEGKPVTDKMVLDWFKQRRAGVSQGDPMWDYYNNQVTEYEFAIENSKMELKYKRKDATDMQMVAFYHKWAAKLPPQSEAYREREKLAAAYADRAASGAAGGRRAASDKAYANAINNSYKKEAAYNTTLFFLEDEAHNRGILKGEETLVNVDPNTSEGHAINALWDEIATAPEYAKHREWYTKQIKANGDGSFNGDFSQDAFNGYTRIKRGAVDDRIKTAKKAGRQGDITDFGKEKDQVRGTSVITGGFDETAMYEDARKTWLDTFEDPNSTPLMIDRANQKYIGDLTKIKAGLEAGLPIGSRDDRLGAVNNEIKTMQGDENPYEHWGGMFGPGENQGGTNATETAQGINQLKQNLANLMKRDANGDPMFVLTKAVNGASVNTTESNHFGVPWAVVPREGLDPNSIYVIQNDYGDPRAGQIVTAITPTPIHMTSDVRDPTTGFSSNQQIGDAPAAFHYLMPDGKVGYKYRDSAGKWLYTPDNPFGPMVTSITSKGGTVNVPGNGVVVPTAANVILPSYYNASANVAMTSRIAKSGYSMWLIASDPKDRTAYAAKPEDIFSSLKLEAGNDVARLQEMVDDADSRRAVYIGTSTEEQQRIRQNFINGTPNPVPLSSVVGARGLKAPGAEQAAINALVGGRTKEQVAGDIQRVDLTNRTGAYAGFTGKQVDDLDTIMRKTSMPTTPPPPIAAKAQAPTSMGSDLPGQIANGLGGFISGLFGQQGKIGVALPGQTPKPSSPYSGPMQIAPGRAPRATAPPPVKPPAPPPAAPKPSAPVAAPKPPPSAGYTVVKDRYGNYAYQPDKGGKAIIA